MGGTPGFGANISPFGTPAAGTSRFGTPGSQPVLGSTPFGSRTPAFGQSQPVLGSLGGFGQQVSTLQPDCCFLNATSPDRGALIILILLLFVSSRNMTCFGFQSCVENILTKPQIFRWMTPTGRQGCSDYSGHRFRRLWQLRLLSSFMDVYVEISRKI